MTDANRGELVGVAFAGAPPQDSSKQDRRPRPVAFVARLNVICRDAQVLAYDTPPF